MKIYTNENNTSTLKLLIAANLAGKKVTLENVTLEGPRALPILQVDDQLAFFSSNAAAEYLFPAVDMSHDGRSQQMQEWEATRLQPAISAVLAAKTVPADLKQALEALLHHVDSLLGANKYLFGDMLSAADVALWSTLYPLYHNEALRQNYLSQLAGMLRWYSDIAAARAVQEAVKQWGGSADKPYAATSALGAPQLPSLASPAGTPLDGPAVVPGPNAEEIAAAKDNWTNGLSQLQPPLQQEKVTMPIKGRKNVLITSSLPYVNNVPHLGNIIGCVLSGDIFHRYCRICDYNAIHISGTDEYGTATETKAIQEGVTPRQICDKYYEIHNDVYRWFDIGFDHFGRTSTADHTEIVQKMFLQVKENGFISSQTVDQLHCEKCNRFLADRFVEGTCPHPGCLYPDARGDQCDKCGKLVNAIELIAPRCKMCSAPPVVKPSEQLFIELGQLEPSLRTWLNKVEGGWSPSARAVARSWLREPLRARAVTRDLKWGVPVPLDGYKDKVFYVWFDAPIGYWSITHCLTKDYEKWWRPEKDINVKLYQFMAKDNVPFHAIMFPTAVLAANRGHVLVDHIFATEYLNYEEGKFSKSRGVGVFGTDAQDTGIPSDVWRFYLASVRPESSDSSFSWVELGTRNNSELLNNLGNFCHRSLSFCANSFKGRVPEVRPLAADFELMALVNREVVAYVQHMEKGRLREALKHVLLISKLGNQHMQSSQPWVLLKGTDDDKERGATAIALCCQLVALLCALIAPYMPAAARRLRAQLNVTPEALRINPQNPSLIQYLPAGHGLGKPEPLFSKIEPDVLEKLKAKYAGTQDDREKKLNGDITTAGSNSSVAELEAAVAAQGERVRNLKASTKDKTVWTPEVNKLLELKKQLAAAQAQPQAPPTSGDSVASLEKAIAEQGDKVRQLKASTKDKAVWAPEVNKLLELKKQLAAAQAQPQAPPTSGDSVASLEKAIAEQGDKVRKLKASTKDKTVWAPEVNVLLDLKKKLAALQTK
ncbi:methionyl-tRNA synthetase 1 isoform X2 [Choristoneura fumiferana]|uniref:methionyl-tRNA synthetase 1 isoform X2 n=1 Tax=Choristoneura fumiferana TaxID=7141 RepID=UPI003D15985F